MTVKKKGLDRAIEEYKKIMEEPKMRKAIEEYKKIMGVTKSYINLPGSDDFIEIVSESHESILEKELQAYKETIETISNIFPDTTDKTRDLLLAVLTHGNDKEKS